MRVRKRLGLRLTRKTRIRGIKVQRILVESKVLVELKKFLQAVTFLNISHIFSSPYFLLKCIKIRGLSTIQQRV